MKNILGKENRKVWMGIGIILVILFHLIYFSIGQVKFPKWFNLTIVNLFGNGWLGVDIFLFLSAYGLCHSLNNNNLYNFYVHRIKRIFPIYLVFLFVVFLFFFDSHSVIDIIHASLGQMTGFAVLKSFGNPDKIEWFTPSLILIYLSFPLVYTFIKFVVEKSKVTLFVLVLMLVFGVNFIGNYISINLATRLPIIISGICTYLYIIGKTENKLSILFVYVAILSFMTNHWMLQMCLCIPLVLLALDKLTLTDSRLKDSLIFIGTYSYEIYLAQVITTRYILAAQGEYVKKLILCLVLTPVISGVFIMASKALNKINLQKVWKV